MADERYLESLQYIEITKQPDKVFYQLNQPFDRRGLVITGFFGDHHSEDLTDVAIANGLTGFDSASIGTKTITATVNEFTATFRVVVYASQAPTGFLNYNVTVPLIVDSGSLSEASSSFRMFKVDPATLAVTSTDMLPYGNSAPNWITSRGGTFTGNRTLDTGLYLIRQEFKTDLRGLIKADFIDIQGGRTVLYTRHWDAGDFVSSGTMNPNSILAIAVTVRPSRYYLSGTFSTHGIEVKALHLNNTLTTLKTSNVDNPDINYSVGGTPLTSGMPFMSVSGMSVGMKDIDVTFTDSSTAPPGTFSTSFSVPIEIDPSIVASRTETSGGSAAAIYYTSLAAAVDAGTNGTPADPDFITLLNDHDFGGAVIAGGRHIALCVPDGLIKTVSRSSLSGSLFNVQAGASLKIYGGTGGASGQLIIDGNTTADSPLINVENGGTVAVMNGVTLRNNRNTGNGGAVSVNGTLVMNGEITGCEAANGGGVYIGNGGALDLHGVISFCTARDSGGGVYVKDNAIRFVQNGGEIRYNRANGSGDNGGGGVYVEMTSNGYSMEGGVVTGNIATNNKGSGVFLKGGGGGQSSNFTIGSASTAYIAQNNDVWLGENRYIKVDMPPLSAKAAYITALSAVRGGTIVSGGGITNQADVNKFVLTDGRGLVFKSDVPYNSGIVEQSELYISGSGNDTTGVGTSVLPYKSLVKAAGLVPAGSAMTIHVVGNALAGGSTTNISDKVITLVGNGAGAAIDGENARRILEIGAGGSVSIENIKLHNGSVAGSGGAVLINGGTLTMISGEISGNKADVGAGVSINSGAFNFQGGIIQGNTFNNPSAGSGSGVYVGTASSANFYMKGSAKVTHGAGNPAGNDVYLTRGKYINVTGTITGGAGISSEDGFGGTVAMRSVGGTLTYAEAAKFEMADGRFVRFSGVATPSAKIFQQTFYIASDSVNSAASDTLGNGTITRPYRSPQKPVNLINLPANSAILNRSTDNFDIVIGGSISSAYAISDGTPIGTDGMVDISGLSVTLHGYSGGMLNANNSRRVLNINGARVTLANGLTLTGGSVASGNGGGVLLTGGTLTMTGGEISDNGAYKGGGIYVVGSSASNPSLVKITGGSIRNNTATINSGNTDGGGGISIYNNAKLEMTGGRIADNESKHYGGGVYLYDTSAIFEMSGGVIIGNKALCDSQGGGGGVMADQASNFTISGGTITGNGISSGEQYGKGVYVWQDTIKMSGSAKIDTDDVHLHSNQITVTGNLTNHTEAKPVNITLNDYPSSSTRLKPILKTDPSNNALIANNYKKFYVLPVQTTGYFYTQQGSALNTDMDKGYAYLPQTVYVKGDSTGDTVANTGSTPALAKRTLNGAFGVVPGGGTITVIGQLTSTSPDQLTGENAAFAIQSKGSAASPITITGVRSGGTGAVASLVKSGNYRTLLLKNSYINLENIVISDATYNGSYGGGGIRIYSGGSLTLGEGVIVGTNSAPYGGGILVGGNTSDSNNSTVVIKSGAKIIGNRSTYTGTDKTKGGGGIHVGTRGVLIIENGALVQGNWSTSDSGGGNTTPSTREYAYGGGIQLVDGGRAAMSGGLITGNTSLTGGGVDVYAGSFTMTGGTIGGNTAWKEGGGVHLEGVESGGQNSFFIMTDGAIINNMAKNTNLSNNYPAGGGGIGNFAGSVSISGSGVVSGNTTQNSGDGSQFFQQHRTSTIYSGTHTGAWSTNDAIP
ncbi:hypothetical protein AGMMS50212_01090 [Spirochaetia bacterium]|nr:hypothetical protein AGMMS50212_01090 [Spirochaetia bacterium]